MESSSVYISWETDLQIEARLRQVIAAATLRWLDGDFAFEEYPAANFPVDVIAGAVAVVRDDDVWSVLRPAMPETAEPFKLFVFHFANNLDNSGFVGWLAMRMKRELGTGTFVVCGQNSQRGGIFDYWGVPSSLAEQARHLVEGLRSGEANASKRLK